MGCLLLGRLQVMGDVAGTWGWLSELQGCVCVQNPRNTAPCEPCRFFKSQVSVSWFLAE